MHIFRPTWNEDISVVHDEVFDDVRRVLDNIHVSPVDPAMVRLHSCREQVVPCLAHGLSARALGSKAMSLLDSLAGGHAEALLDDHGGPEGSLWVVLHAFQLHCERGHGVIRCVADEEGQVNELVRVGELGEQVEVLGEIVRGIAQRGQDENLLLVSHGVDGRLDSVQFDVLDLGGVDLDGLAVVEYDGGGEVAVPFFVLIRRHAHGGFGGPEAVESGQKGSGQPLITVTAPTPTPMLRDHVLRMRTCGGPLTPGLVRTSAPRWRRCPWTAIVAQWL